MLNVTQQTAIVFKHKVNEKSLDDVISCLTPEILIRGYDVPSISVIPQLHCDSVDEDYMPQVSLSDKQLHDAFEQLRLVKNKFYPRQMLVGGEGEFRASFPV